MSNEQQGRREALNRDFTVERYRELIRIAKRKYEFVDYKNIALNRKFILWRHDVDYSLNRSLRLAEIEHAEGVKSTYFVNPHSEFYNVFEASQARLIRQILALGHDIGLHFDAAYHQVANEAELDALVADEASLLQKWFHFKPQAFSFHNPTPFLLSCENDSYGGLMNCYSSFFKSNVSYCSDSNGYWRFKALGDVLNSATDPCLQVLTHPGWWQSEPRFPRERIFRSTFGRAASVMDFYDAALETDGRENRSGPASSLSFLKKADKNLYRVCDYLWNSRHLNGLLLELYRLHIRQSKSMVRAYLVNAWRIPPLEVDTFLQDSHLAGHLASLIPAVCNLPWATIAGTSDIDHERWPRLCQVLVRDGDNIPTDTAEDGCIYFCRLLAKFAAWGESQSAIGHDGISNTVSPGASPGLEPESLLAFPSSFDKWRALKQKFSLVRRP